MNPPVHDWVAYHAERQPDAPALSSIEDGTTTTWGELEERVARLAHALREHYALRSGDRVALLAENDTRIFELQFACMRTGVILAPLNWRLAAGELTALMADAEPRLLVHDDTWSTTASQLAGETKLPRRMAWGVPHDADEYEACLAAAARLSPRTDATVDDITHILYTSGTTGRPKGALSTQGTLMWHALNFAHTCRVAERNCHHLNVVPLFHAGGLNVYSNPILYWGGHVSTVRRFDAATTLALLTDADRAITHLCGVLQMYELITSLPAFSSATFPTLRCALFGGWGPSTPWIHSTWRSRGFSLQLSYGATEIGPNVTVLNDDADAVDRNSSGHVLPYTEVRLVNRDGVDLGDDEVGEIWVRGPSITPGYWNRPKADFFDDDWFKTGDCARRDGQGHYYIVDRLREVFRSGGENVYPAEVEAVLAQMPDVLELAIIGVPDEQWGEVGLAVVVPRPGATVSLQTLTDFAAGKLARFKQPRHIEVVDELPRNVTAKVARDELRQRFRPSFTNAIASRSAPSR